MPKHRAEHSTGVGEVDTDGIVGEMKFDALLRGTFAGQNDLQATVDDVRAPALIDNLAVLQHRLAISVELRRDLVAPHRRCIGLLGRRQQPAVQIDRYARLPDVERDRIALQRNFNAERTR